MTSEDFPMTADICGFFLYCYFTVFKPTCYTEFHQYHVNRYKLRSLRHRIGSQIPLDYTGNLYYHKTNIERKNV